jgi:hypothetical protein
MIEHTGMHNHVMLQRLVAAQQHAALERRVLLGLQPEEDLGAESTTIRLLASVVQACRAVGCSLHRRRPDTPVAAVSRTHGTDRGAPVRAGDHSGSAA